VVIADARDPSAAGDFVAWHSSNGGVLAREGTTPEVVLPLPGANPALGGSLLAWREEELVRVVRAEGLVPVVDLTAPGIGPLAVSDEWLVYRRPLEGGDELIARRLPDGPEQTVIATRTPALLGRPALSGATLVFHVAGPRRSRIDEVDLTTMARRTLRSSTLAQLTNPALDGQALVYVRETNVQQQLTDGRRVLARAAGVSRRDSGFERGHSHHTRTPRARTPAANLLWTTALSPRFAYVTLAPLRGGTPQLLQVAR
jgi:hypothetical protein